MNDHYAVAIACGLLEGSACSATPPPAIAPEPSATQAHPVPTRAAAPDPGRLEISRAGSRPSAVGAAANFTGTAVIDPLFAAHAQRHVGAASVTFTPGTRTHWHTHPAGQTLVVTAGSGWVQEWGGARQEIHPGDVIWTPPGVKHWHGATANNAMTHLAIQEQVDGKVVEWMEPVVDAQYQR